METIKKQQQKTPEATGHNGIKKMARVAKTFLIKANTRLIYTATTKQELRDKANAYERTIQGSRYKREYCVYNESDGMHFGYHFNLFDE